ncbi:hypothetical protein BRADI_4g01185v3 [Brachypodium distachyon]|uniref:Uncharacterized protein n=1 Tax=Brachypodium distachyon TaxID=15368 RepID=A0A2K2CJT6_BRADI|nr:hypothetical protein BRADI_4g01185v3 [Brachypodium distachyon]
MDQLSQSFEFARKSVVWISFKWGGPKQRPQKQTVVLPGIIVSIKDDGSTCLAVADATFFSQKHCPFVVNLPIAGQKYDTVPVASPSIQFLGPRLCTLVLQLRGNDYVRPVTIESACPDVR